MEEERQQRAKNLKSTLIRMPETEKKLGIKIENATVSINSDNDVLQIFGEVLPDGDPAAEDFDIYVVLYNADGEVINTDHEYIRDFDGYDTFKFYIYDSDTVPLVESIRMYVKES